MNYEEEDLWEELNDVSQHTNPYLIKNRVERETFNKRFLICKKCPLFVGHDKCKKHEGSCIILSVQQKDKEGKCPDGKW